MRFVISYNNAMAWYQDRIFRRIFIALALVKTLAFIYICFFHPLGEAVLVFPDSLSYIYPAQTLLQHGALWEAVSANPLLLRTPGYPLFLALIQLVFNNLTWAVAGVQNVLSLFLLVPVYLTARQLAGQTAARWAAALCALSGLYFSLSFAVLTEVLCTFLLSWFVYITIRLMQDPRPPLLLGSALLLAAAVYVRPAAYYFAFAAALMLVCFSAGRLIRCSVRNGLVFFLLPLALGLGGWQVRNYVQTGFGGFTSVGAYNLYIWNEDYLAQKFSIPVPQAHQALEQALPPGFKALPAKEQVRIYKALALPLIQESFGYKLIHAPLWAAKTLFGANFVHLSRLLHGGHAAPEELDRQMLDHTSALHTHWLTGWGDKLLFALAEGQVFITVLAGIVGFFMLWKKHRAEIFFLAVYCLYFWAIGSTFFGAYARFRAPFEFVLCITAGAAAAGVQNRWNKKKLSTAPANRR